MKSIKRRLLLWLLVPLISLCGISTFVAYKLAWSFANKSHDELLLNAADSIAARIRRDEKGVLIADLPMAAQDILRHNGRDNFYYQILDSNGKRLTGDSILPLPRNMSLKGAQFRYARVKEMPIRICRIPVHVPPSADEIWVQCAKTLNSRKLLQNEIFLSIVVPQFLLVVLASFSVWLGIRTGLAPLRKLGRLLKARDKLDLSPVIVGDTPEELEPVTQALNDLFFRAEKQINLQKEFVSNAAHQLRTPITAMKTYIDYANRTSEGSRDILVQMAEATGRVVRLVNKLLILARTEGKSGQTVGVANLSAAITSAGKHLVHEANARRVKLEFDIPEVPVKVLADQGDLEELVNNLLENAIKYSGSNGPGIVWLSLCVDDSVTLNVEDNGPGICDTEKSKVFERFYRISNETDSGCGLGLSIVSEIAAKYSANVSLKDRPGGGSVFQVVFISSN